MAKVTVLISAYNEEHYVAASIQSIIDQTHADLEILVADDGSSDGTFDIIQSFQDPRLKSFRNENQGKAATLNFLLEHATGEYVVIQDGDDISVPNRIQVLHECMEQNPKLGLALSGHALLIDNKPTAPRSIYRDEATCKTMIDALQLPGHDPTACIRTTIARNFKFNSELKVGQGVDFIFRVAEQYPIMVLEDVLYHYRVHFKSVTRSNPEKKARNLFVVMNLAKQRRQQAEMDFDEFMSANAQWARDPDNNLSGHFVESTFISVSNGKRGEAIRTALVALRYISRNIRYAKPMLYALTPGFVGAMGKKLFGRG